MGSSFLRQLPREKRNELVRAVKPQVLAPGIVVFRQDDPADSFYIIRSGKVRVFHTDSDGLETELSTLGPEESFGEMALLTGEARSATVETLEETHLMVLSKEQFERILKDFPEITLAFLKQMSGWILKKDMIIENDVRQHNLPPRVSWLDFLSIIALSVLLALVFNQSNPSGISLFPKSVQSKAITVISPAEAMAEMKKADALFVDAGPEGFYQRRHIQGAISVPLSFFDILYEVTFSEVGKAKKVIVYGGTVSRLYDWELASKLLLKGHKDVRVLQGGTTAWEKAGYPLQKWEPKE